MRAVLSILWLLVASDIATRCDARPARADLLLAVGADEDDFYASWSFYVAALRARALVYSKQLAQRRPARIIRMQVQRQSSETRATCEYAGEMFLAFIDGRRFPCYYIRLLH